jgi:hypothetical protein
MAKATGLTPEYGFAYDEQQEITTSAVAAAKTLTNIRTIAVRVLADITGDATVTVTVGGEAIVFGAADADPDGTFTAFVRGALCSANNNVIYATNAGTGSVTVRGVYYDSVEFD